MRALIKTKLHKSPNIVFKCIASTIHNKAHQKHIHQETSLHSYACRDTLYSTASQSTFQNSVSHFCTRWSLIQILYQISLLQWAHHLNLLQAGHPLMPLCHFLLPEGKLMVHFLSIFTTVDGTLASSFHPLSPRNCLYLHL